MIETGKNFQGCITLTNIPDTYIGIEVYVYDKEHAIDAEKIRLFEQKQDIDLSENEFRLNNTGTYTGSCIYTNPIHHGKYVDVKLYSKGSIKIPSTNIVSVNENGQIDITKSLQDYIDMISGVKFTTPTARTPLLSGDSLSKLTGQINRHLLDLKPHAFKDKLSISDIESAAMQSKPTANTLVKRDSLGNFEVKTSANLGSFAVNPDGTTKQVSDQNDLGDPRAIQNVLGDYLPNGSTYPSGSSPDYSFIAANLASLLRHRHYKTLDHPDGCIELKKLSDDALDALMIQRENSHNISLNTLEQPGAYAVSCDTGLSATYHFPADMETGTVIVSDAPDTLIQLFIEENPVTGCRMFTRSLMLPAGIGVWKEISYAQSFFIVDKLPDTPQLDRIYAVLTYGAGYPADNPNDVWYELYLPIDRGADYSIQHGKRMG